ncbi:ABC transporter ATP-binding protein [Lactobacillus helveticus]|uniref:ATP-binding cassette domain-containing protein n=1 Tax=Lactobacillus helveticus TaxID=1587 RepID=A0A3S8SDF8_LACHE|nr:ATP-binding cassette domain-containing protein [Lactobacillus helveticus]AFR21108.1 ABC transporter ATP binding protein [Lactobacillus helveticus R0052]AZK91816.1 Choline transport ATP-binding protein OpuBA [Lactobacillus helveticus]MBW7988276.1 ATP-binding cassette domain-containing protein [Lactobacillus helveticus]MCJ2190363.1 ATP-binding cassette domain-containing protein [Lactobacillus helveticus]MED7628375.1 ATP-binding cassette domain-containing protein [Lactobacillus helveticus]
MSTILDLQNITTTVNVGTNEEKNILKNINLKINDGDFITLLGTNGAGKSTLLNIINGSVFPTSGKIILKDRDLTNLSEVKRANNIAQVFQDPKMGTAPRMTVAENLLLATKRGQRRGLRMRGLDQHLEDFKRETAQLPNGLNERLNTFVGNLSGGQRQTLSFLMATIKKPELLLLDEHTAALDPNTSRQLLELTNKVVKKEHLTCIMITHQLKDAIKYGNRTIILNSGKIVLDVNGQEKKNLTEEDILQYFTD